MCTVIHSVKKLRVEPMTAKAGSRGHVRWAGRMTMASCVMTHDLAMPAECTGRSSTLEERVPLFWGERQRAASE